MASELQGLKFILERSILDIVLPENECKKIIDDWLAGKLPKIIGNPNQLIAGANGWAVRTDTIVGLAMLPLPQPNMQNPYPQSPQQLGAFTKSGIY